MLTEKECFHLSMLPRLRIILGRPYSNLILSLIHGSFLAIPINKRGRVGNKAVHGSYDTVDLGGKWEPER